MSWGIKWTVPFKSILGNAYTVQILEDGYTGTETRLQPAASPFETSEDRSDDRFKPVRSQTGYIRIADNGTDLDGNPFDWQELLPSTNAQHQVRLVDSNNTILWIGYMKADMYTTEIFQNVVEYEFPILCPLALLESMQLEFTSRDMENYGTIGQALYMLLKKTGVSWQYVDVCYNVANFADLNARFDYMNFTAVDPTVEYVTEVATWTDQSARMSDILDAICSFWGWTIMSRGLNVYIVANDDTHHFRRFAFASLASVLSSQQSTYEAENLNIGDLTYVSTNHSCDYLLGKNKVTIESDVNEEQNIIDPAFQELTYTWYGGTNHIIAYGSSYYAIQFYLSNTTTHTEFLHQLRLVFNPVYLVYPANILLSMDDTWSQSDNDNKTSIALRHNIQILTGGTLPGSVLAQRTLGMKTLHYVFAPSGSMICISASARHSLDPRTSYNFVKTRDYVRMYVRLGDKYWNESTTSWTSTPEALKVYIGSNSEIYTTKTLFNPHYGAKGYCIGMSESLYGQLEVAILMAPYTDVILDNFTVKIVPTDDTVFPTAKSTNEYTGVASPNFKENEEVSLSLASGSNNKFGRGQLYKENGDYLTSVDFYNAETSTTTTEVPERHLLARYRGVYNDIRNRMELNIRPSAGAVLPTTTFTHWEDPTRVFVPQAIQRDWGDDSMKLTVIEL